MILIFPLDDFLLTTIFLLVMFKTFFGTLCSLIKYAYICLHIFQEVIYTARPRGRPRNRRQDEVREDGRLVGGKGWKERVYNREEWTKLLRTARNHHILHMPME
jgi:hypothetical protein